MKHLISVVLCSFAFCASWSQVNIYNEDLVSKDSSLLFKDLINHISIDGSRQMKAIELSAEGALVSYVGPGKYLVHDVEADRVKLSVLKIENEKSQVIFSKEFIVQKSGKPVVSLVREEDVILSNGEPANHSYLKITVPNGNYRGSWEVAHFEMTLVKSDGSILMPATFISGRYPGKIITDQIKLLGKGGKIVIEQVVLKYKDGPYQKYGSFTVQIQEK